MKTPIVTVVGGSGFIGRHVVKALCNAGYVVRVLCRDTIAAAHLRTAGNVGQVVLQHADITSPESIKGKLDGSFAVINLVSALYSRGKQNFRALNVTGAEAIAKEAQAIGAERFIHISALGVEQAQDTHYGRSKLAGERAVLSAFPNATIFRPSLVFGPGDDFFDRFARMSLFLPFLPLIRGGSSEFQPVYAEDVALAVVNALRAPDAAGKTYELAGPRRYSFKILLTQLMQVTGRLRRLAPIPSCFAAFGGAICELLPFPPAITRDQVRLLKHNNVATGNTPGLEALGITPRALEPLLPSLLERYIAR